MIVMKHVGVDNFQKSVLDLELILTMHTAIVETLTCPHARWLQEQINFGTTVRHSIHLCQIRLGIILEMACVFAACWIYETKKRFLMCCNHVLFICAAAQTLLVLSFCSATPYGMHTSREINSYWWQTSTWATRCLCKTKQVEIKHWNTQRPVRPQLLRGTSSLSH